MKLFRSFVLLVAPAVAFAGFALAAPQQNGKGKSPGKDKSAENAKAEHEKVASTIEKSAKLPKANYWRHAEAMRGAKMRKIAATPLVAAKGGGGKGGGGKAGLAAGTKSSLTIVGGEGLPQGFGSGFSWDRADNEVMLVMFINAADPLGVSIDGLVAGDTVQV